MHTSPEAYTVFIHQLIRRLCSYLAKPTVWVINWSLELHLRRKMWIFGWERQPRSEEATYGSMLALLW